MPSVVVTLPESMRAELKEPLGPVFTDAERLLSSVDGPIIAVGDIVTYHLERAGRTPDVAVVDGKTKRETVDREVRSAVNDDVARVDVENPAGALSEDLLAALGDAIRTSEDVVLVVEGEEDLATLPAVLAAPTGAAVVYGQPDEGMVRAEVTPESKREVADLLGRMDGDAERLRDLLDVEQK